MLLVGKFGLLSLDKLTFLQHLKSLDLNFVPDIVQVCLGLQESRVDHQANLLVGTLRLLLLLSTLNRSSLDLPSSHRLDSSHEVIKVEALVGWVKTLKSSLEVLSLLSAQLHSWCADQTAVSLIDEGIGVLI